MKADELQWDILILKYSNGTVQGEKGNTNRSLKLKLKILVQDHDSRSQLNLNNFIKKLNKINQIPPLAHLSGDFFVISHVLKRQSV